MLTFFAALHQTWMNPPSLKLSFPAIIEDTVIACTDLQRASVKDVKNYQLH